MQELFYAAVAADDGRQLLHTVVEPTRGVDVYAHAYRVRLEDALAADFPKLRALLGAADFRELAREYLRVFPPSRPSIRDVGDRLASFLATREPTCADLAALERARVEAFDAADAVAMTRDSLISLPPDQFPHLNLALVSASRVVEITTNADDIWDAIESDRQPPPRIVAASRTVLVWRRDFIVIHRTLERDEAAAIRRVTNGCTFASVCDELVTGNAPIERALELLLRWLDAGVLAQTSRT